MWETLDGEVLRLSCVRRAALAARHRLLGLTHLIRRHYQGDLQAAIVRAVGRLARGANRAGTLRRAATGRTYTVFNAAHGGRIYRILARPVGNCQSEIVSVRFERYEREYLDSHGHRIAQTAVVNALIQQGLELQGDGVADAGPGVIRDNRRQLDTAGRNVVRRGRQPGPGFLMPDASYLALRNPALPNSLANQMRVNVEIETNADQMRDKLRQLVQRDPNSMHVSLLVNRDTGEVMGRQVYDPRTSDFNNRAAALRRRRGMPGHAEPLGLGAMIPAPIIPVGTAARPAPTGPQVTFGTGAAPPPAPRRDGRGGGTRGAPTRRVPRRPPTRGVTVPGARRRPARPARESELMMESLAFY